MKSDKTKRYDLLAAVLCISALVLALFIGTFHKVGFLGVETDFYDAYAKQAENILAGRPYTYQHNPPGYSLLLAAVTRLTKDIFVAGKIISAFALTLFGWMVYLLFKSLFDIRIAFLSFTLTLIVLIRYSYLASTDMIGLAMIFLSLWMILHNRCPNRKLYFFSGVFAGLAYLIRSTSIFIIAGIIFSVVLINADRKIVLKRFLNSSIFIAGVLLVTSPWFIYNWKRSGSPLASTAYQQIGANFFYPDREMRRYITALRYAESKFDSFTDVLLYDPVKLSLIYFKDISYTNILSLVTSDLLFPASIFIGTGLCFLLADLSRRRLMLLLIFLFGYLMQGLVAFDMRYFYFLIPLLFLVFNYAIFQKDVYAFLDRIKLPNIHISWLIVTTFIVFFSLRSFDKIRNDLKNDPRYLLEISSILKNRSNPDDIIISRKPHIPYLSGLEGIFPLANNPTEYLEKARELGARYLVYSDFEAYLWPGLKDFVDPKSVPEGFKLIYQHEKGNTLIYEILR